MGCRTRRTGPCLPYHRIYLHTGRQVIRSTYKIWIPGSSGDISHRFVGQSLRVRLGDVTADGAGPKKKVGGAGAAEFEGQIRNLLHQLEQGLIRLERTGVRYLDVPVGSSGFGCASLLPPLLTTCDFGVIDPIAMAGQRENRGGVTGVVPPLCFSTLLSPEFVKTTSAELRACGWERIICQVCQMRRVVRG